MFTNNNSNKITLLLLILILSFLVHCGILASENADAVDSVFPENEVKLSKESAQLLEQIKKGVVEYNKKLKSGRVVFTLTLSEHLKDHQQNAKKEEFGTWHIVYTFEGARHFYDVRIHKKMEFDGTLLPNWKEERYQFQIDNKKMLIREAQQTGWIQLPQPTDESIFKPEFNPRRWGWNPDVFSFEFLIKFYNPIKVERVEANDAQLYLITLQRVDNEKSSRTRQLWIDPQKGYRPIRSVQISKMLSHTTLVSLDGTRERRLPPEVAVSHGNTTYQIEQFEPGIWFPKTAIFTIQGFRKTTMQVQKAVFNIPIDEKDLRFPD